MKSEDKNKQLLSLLEEANYLIKELDKALAEMLGIIIEHGR